MGRKILVIACVLTILAALALQQSSTSSLPSWPLFHFGVYLNSLLTDLQRMTTPPQAWLTSKMFGFLFSKALYLACKFNFAEILHDGPLSVQHISSLAHTDPETTDRVLKFLSVYGIFSKVPEGYANAPLAEYLRADHPESVRGFLVHLDLMDRASDGFAAAMKDGAVPYQVTFQTNLTFWDYLAQDKQEKEIFDKAMVSASNDETEAIMLDYPWHLFSAGKVVDVGGGIGHLTAALLRKYPFKGVVIDTDITLAVEYWTTHFADVMQKAEFVKGSFFESIPIGGDVYILKHILCDWDDRQSMAILKSVANAMRETKANHPTKHPRLLYIDLIYDFPPKLRMAADVDMLMLVFRGKERSVAEIDVLCREVGLKVINMVPLRSRVSVVEIELA